MKKVLSYLGNAVLTVIVLVTLLLTLSAVIGTLEKKHPQVFGYGVSQIQSGSMRASGFSVGDYVVTGFADASSLKVGDIVTYYRDSSSKRPLLSSDKRDNFEVVFHEIVQLQSVDGATVYVTKGSSNNTVDEFVVPYQSIMGKLIPINKTLMIGIGFIVGGSAFIYWIIACVLLFILKEFVQIGRYLEDDKLSKKVERGEIYLVDQRCFERNICEGFSKRKKKSLRASAPQGFGAIYDFLLYRRPERDSVHKKALQKKRFTQFDAAALVYAAEPLTQLDAAEYVANLPMRNRRYDQYANAKEYEVATHKKAIKRNAVALGSLVFFGACLAACILSGFFLAQSIIFRAVLIGLTAIALVMTIRGGLGSKRWIYESKDYFKLTVELPTRYKALSNPTEISFEECRQGILAIEEAMRGKAMLYLPEKCQNPQNPTEAEANPPVAVAVAQVDKKPTTAQPMAETETEIEIEIETETEIEEETETETEIEIEAEAETETDTEAETETEIEAETDTEAEEETETDTEAEAEEETETETEAEAEEETETETEIEIEAEAETETDTEAETETEIEAETDTEAEEETETDTEAEAEEETETETEELVTELQKKIKAQPMEGTDVEHLTFVKETRSYSELLEHLPEMTLVCYAELKSRAQAVPSAKTSIGQSGERINVGRRTLISLKIRRGKLLALFEVENDTVREFVGDTDADLIQKIKITLCDAESLARAVNVLEAVILQAERKEAQKKAARAEARRQKRQEKMLAQNSGQPEALPNEVIVADVLKD